VRPVRSTITATVVAAAIASSYAAAANASPPKSGGSGTTSAVTVSITSPAAGASVSSAFTVSGTAKSKKSIKQVVVKLDGGAATTAAGTSSWSASLTAGAGSHTITATATDSNGATGTTSVAVTVASTGGSGGSGGSGSSGGGSTNGGFTDKPLTNPADGDPLMPLGRGKQAEWGAVDVLLGYDMYDATRLAVFRDSTSGATSAVTLPVDTSAGWSNADYVMTSASDLWIESGDGPVYVRHYRFSGSPTPTSASLVSSQTFGTGDSRHGNITSLTSGALVVVWHQQGASGAQGQYVAYRTPSGSWQATLGPFTFMPTASSTQVVAQHPADGSVWVFSDADTWGSIGAIHLTESGSSLSVDWTKSDYINTNANGDNGPDPEYPDLALAKDTSTGTLVLAYQSAHRVMFNSSTTGSYVAIDRIAANGSMSFTTLPVYVERTSALGLVVRPGQTWVAYRPVDQQTLTYTHLNASCYCNGSWQPATDLGIFKATADRVGYGVSRAVFAGRMSDGGLHLVSAN
jgi:hypothetical protein